MREAGTVKWFGPTFGFIKRDAGGQVYFHQTNLPRHRRFDPQTGDRVTYEVREGERGEFAALVELESKDITKCESTSSKPEESSGGS